MFSIVGLLIISQFTNCANIDGSANSLHYSSELCLQDDSCNQPQSNLLSLKIDTNNFVSDQHDFVNVSGECHHGNYDEHLVKWRYGDNSSSANSLRGACVNGRFVIDVSAAGLTEGRSRQVFLKIVGLQNQTEIDGPSPESVITLSR